MEKIDIILEKLAHSKFRNSFYLTQKDKNYIKEKRIVTIKKHAYDFIQKRLTPYPILNDGKQTPYHGHPVFKAEHATATCCRNCLYKWYKIPKNRSLTEHEVDYIVEIIITWIIRQLNNNNK